MRLLLVTCVLTAVSSQLCLLRGMQERPCVQMAAVLGFVYGPLLMLCGTLYMCLLQLAIYFGR